MLFNEPKLLKSVLGIVFFLSSTKVSVLFNEPKLLKFAFEFLAILCAVSFSALQRAEIAEIRRSPTPRASSGCFSALQRAEIAEIYTVEMVSKMRHC